MRVNSNSDGRTAAAEPVAKPPNVRSIIKAFQVLEAFRERDRFLNLSDIAAATGLDKSAVQRFTRTLRDLGYLEQEPTTRRYSLGRRLLDLSFWFLRSHPLTDRAVPVLVDLRQAVGERVDLVLPDGDFILYVIRMQAKREAVRPALVGRRVPQFCSAGGRAMLACLDEAEALRIITASDRRAFTPHTKTDPDAILEEVRKARAKGYAVQSQEWLLTETVAAAAVTDNAGKPIGAINIAAHASDLRMAEFERRIAPALLAAARELKG
ncbi:IclR family transcriptional regulator [Siccirubricoccus phaeus]|uniref:IclR family transcriptional regulator n=1 Tax=Siccirubricoccus phaeus TaxID=2595053 RepID=UPI0011F2292D|nr:IclR family transcriptional regulator [Siccirubricoccus phaeus]